MMRGAAHFAAALVYLRMTQVQAAMVRQMVNIRL